MEAEARFPSMGSEAHVLVVGDPALVDLARQRLADLEARWSRFIADSEISKLNARRGVPTEVSADTLALVVAAVDAWRTTGGLFDPTVLGDMVRAGYDRPFQAVAASPGRGVSTLVRNAGGIVIDRAASTVTLPDNAGFDPGGIGKGVAADMVVEELLAAGADGACVNVGGDLRVEGVGPDDGRWVADIRHPLDDSPIAVVVLAAGGIATSTTVKRSWSIDGQRRHHLLDAAADLIGATALSRTAAQAEVAAKVALLSGDTAALDGLVVLADGSVRRTLGMADFEIEPVA